MNKEIPDRNEKEVRIRKNVGVQPQLQRTSYAINNTLVKENCQMK